MDPLKFSNGLNGENSHFSTTARKHEIVLNTGKKSVFEIIQTRKTSKYQIY